MKKKEKIRLDKNCFVQIAEHRETWVAYDTNPSEALAKWLQGLPVAHLLQIAQIDPHWSAQKTVVFGLCMAVKWINSWIDHLIGQYMAIMRSQFKKKWGETFSLSGIWTLVPCSQKPVCYQRAMLPLLSGRSEFQPFGIQIGMALNGPNCLKTRLFCCWFQLNLLFGSRVNVSPKFPELVHWLDLLQGTLEWQCKHWTFLQHRFCQQSEILIKVSKSKIG